MTFLRKVLLAILIVIMPITMHADPKKDGWNEKPTVFEYIVAGAGVFLGSYAFYKLSKSFYQWIFKSKPKQKLNKYIMVGKSQVTGNEKKINANTMLKQLVVYPQKGESCGYHAVLNACLIANECLNEHGDLHDQVQSADYIQELIGQNGHWRTYFKTIRKSFMEESIQQWVDQKIQEYIENFDEEPSGDIVAQFFEDAENALHKDKSSKKSTIDKAEDRLVDMTDRQDDKIYEDQIQFLIDLERGNTQGDFLQSFKGMILDENLLSSNNLDFTVLAPLESRFDQSMQAAIDIINAAQGPYVHAFIINLGGYHWITHVVFKQENGKIEHILADSIATPSSITRFETKEVKKIINELQKKRSE